MRMVRWRRGVVLGAVLASAAGVLVGAVLVGAQSASASPRCLAWIDSPYFNDDTGASGWTSVCAVEQDGDTGGDPADGSAPDGALSPVDMGTPRELDPVCRTKVTSGIDANVGPSHANEPVGFPAGATAAHPTVVHVTFDTNLSSGAWTAVDWRTRTVEALALWQYELTKARVPIRFEVDPTPASSNAVELGMWGALGAGELTYQWHVRAIESYEDASPGTYADTSTIWSDPDGRTLYADTRIVNKDWSKDAPIVIAGLIAHEFGHALGLANMPGPDRTTDMAGHFYDGALQPTCSDGWSVKRAMSQDPKTGYTPLDDGL